MDSNGAYSQLIRLQEVNAERNRAYADDSNNIQTASYTANSMSGRSSRKSSFERSISRHSPQDGSRRNSHTFPSIEHEAKKGDDVKSGKNVFGRLLHLHKPETPILILGCTASVANGAILPVFGLLISSAIKTFYEPPHKLRKDSVFWAEMYVMLGMLSMLILPVQYSMFYMAGGKLIERIRALSFTRVVYQEIGWFDDPLNSRYFFPTQSAHIISGIASVFVPTNFVAFFVFYSGAIGSRLSADAASIRSIAGDVLSLLVQNISTAIVGIAIAMIANWKLACIVLCFVPCVFAQSYAQARFMRGFSANAKVFQLFFSWQSYHWVICLLKILDVGRKCMSKQARLLVMPSVTSELWLPSALNRRLSKTTEKNVKAP